MEDYLNGLVWDNIYRTEDWLSIYLGAEDNAYTRAIRQRWLLGAVARIFTPDSKVDTCLILEGEQGSLKSSALRVLGEPWFTDDVSDLGTKDAALQIRGTWIAELAELDSMSRGDVARTKAFMSRAVDRFRPPYGKHVIQSPRQVIFAGTVNLDTYLRDETGGRRFWPVRCGKIDLEALQRDRDQLWAEAVTLYREGQPWWLDKPELVEAAAIEQEDRYEADAWEAVLAKWLEFRSDASVDEALKQCFEKPVAQWTHGDKIRVGRCFKALGWTRHRDGPRNAREWRYHRPVSQA